MGWFKDKFAAESIECPRGWGQVSFVLNVTLLPFIVAIEHKCPIGGVEHCTKCRYPFEPGSIDQLRLRLEELDELRGSTLSEEEFRIRRRLLVDARDPPQGIPGRAAATAALVLGPLGVAGIGAGWYLSSVVHAGFLGLLGGGLVLSALAVGFAGLSMIQRRTLPTPPDDRLLAGPHEDTRDLEARLERAEEELGFFRELHEPESLGQPQPPDTETPHPERPHRE